MSETLLSQGTNLMVFGMGTVFVFLTILVFTTRIMSSFITKYLPEPEPQPVAIPANRRSSSEPVDPKVLSVIQAAVDKHRNNRS